MWHSDILLSRISDVNTGNLGHTIRFLGQEEKKNALNNQIVQRIRQEAGWEGLLCGLRIEKVVYHRDDR